MTAEKLWSVIEHYKSELIKLGIVPKQMTPEEYDSREAGQDKDVMLPHCAWMLDHCLRVFKIEYLDRRQQSVEYYDKYAGGFSDIKECMSAEFNVLGKAMRWMAYVQGVLNAFGVYSCNHLRDHSRAAQNEFKTPKEEHGK